MPAGCAEKLGIERMLVPPGAGVGSAIGFLRAPFSFEATRSVYMRLSAFKPAAVTALVGELEREATTFVRTCDPDAPLAVSTRVYMRYVGQGWEIPVDVTHAAPTVESYRALFEAEYAKLFSRTVEGLDVEITVWAVNASTLRSKPLPAEPLGALRPIAATGTRDVFDATVHKRVKAGVYERSQLGVGQLAEGPCIIVEDETTIIVPSNAAATCRSDGCIEIFKRRDTTATVRQVALAIEA